VYFSSTNCELCEKLEPQYKLASELTKLATFAKINSDDEKEIISKLNIRIFPFILLYKD